MQCVEYYLFIAESLGKTTNVQIYDAYTGGSFVRFSRYVHKGGHSHTPCTDTHVQPF